MNKLLVTIAATAMMLGASAGYAQNNGPLYVTVDGDTMMVMGGGPEGVRVLGDTTYAMPSDCPEGAYYRSAENQLTACGEDGAAFTLVAPEAGTMMSSGEAYPEGSMMLNDMSMEEQDSDNRQDQENSGN